LAGEHIVVVDGDPTYLRLICSNLETEGYRVTCGTTGEEAIALVAKCIPDLIVLEVLLPDIDGFEVCRRVREISTVPIIILSSMDTEEDKVKGLRLGADDYLTKPFSAPELQARTEAVLRRARLAESAPSQVTLKVGDLQIDSLQRRVTLRGQEVALPPVEYRLLWQLAANPHVVLTHDYLLEKVWGATYQGEREILRAAVWRLRKKLEEDLSNPRYIITYPGAGYMIAAPE